MFVNVVPVAVISSFLGATGHPIDMATVFIMGISLGIAVDDTSFYVHEFLDRRRLGDGALASALHHVGPTMIATCEAFQLARKLGLDPQVFYDISSKASGQSWSMTSYCPVPGVGPKTPADNDYEGGFAAALMLKDLKLAMEAAKHAGVDVEMGEEAEELYEEFVEKGGGSKDFSGLIKMIDGSWKA